MNSELLKRLIRAIAANGDPALVRLAERVVDDEEKKRHSRLAKQLREVLATSKNVGAPPPARITAEDTRELPRSRRYQDLLLHFTPQEHLQHHMVLPPEVEERFARIEKEYAARERLARSGLKPRRRILLYGPPGCGKTLGAQRLAWNTGLPLLKVRFDALISAYFGETAANLRAVFERANDRPSVLLLDECDSIARSRIESRDVGEMTRVVNALLQFVEEYDLPGLLVAATNIEKALDPALFRRFDDVFEVPLPGSNEILALLRMTLSGVNVSESVTWEPLVNQLQGKSAAHVVRVAQDAAKTAVLCSERAVEPEHLSDAILRHERDA